MFVILFMAYLNYYYIIQRIISKVNIIKIKYKKIINIA